MLKNNALKKIAFGFLLSTTLVSASNFEEKESKQYYYSSTSREEEYWPSQEEEQYTQFSLESMESFLNNWNKEYKETLDDTSGFSERASGLLNQYGQFLSEFIKYNGKIREQSNEDFSKIFFALCGKNDPAILAKFLLVLHPDKFISSASESNSWLLGQFIAGTFKALPKNEETTELSLNILDFWSEFLRNKEHENRQANERSQEMQNQINTLEQEKESLEKGRQLLLEELKAEKSSYSSYQYAAEEAEKRAAEYERKVGELNAQISSLELELGSNKDKIESVEGQLLELKEERERLNKLLEQQGTQLTELYETNEILHTQNISLNKANNASKEAISQKDMTIQNQGNIILNFQNALGKSAFALLVEEKNKTVESALNDQIEELKNERAKLENKIAKLEESKNALEGQIFSVVTSSETLEKEKELLETELGHTKSKLEKQKEYIEKLECNKNESDLKIKGLEERIVFLQHELDKKSSESSYREELEKIFKAMNELKEEQSEGFRSVKSSSSKIYIPEVNEAEKEDIARLEAELEKRENRLADLESELEQSENKNKVLESRVETLEQYNSTKEEKIILIESEYANELKEKNKAIEVLSLENNRLEEAASTAQSELEKLREELRMTTELNKNFIEKLKQYKDAAKTDVHESKLQRYEPIEYITLGEFENVARINSGVGSNEVGSYKGKSEGQNFLEHKQLEESRENNESTVLNRSSKTESEESEHDKKFPEEVKIELEPNESDKGSTVKAEEGPSEENKEVPVEEVTAEVPTEENIEEKTAEVGVENLNLGDFFEQNGAN